MRRFLAAVLLLGSHQAFAQTRGANAIPIKAGVTVSPDTVRVGDPFRVTVGIRAPLGATIEFPRATDSASSVQSLREHGTTWYYFLRQGMWVSLGVVVFLIASRVDYRSLRKFAPSS